MMTIGFYLNVIVALLLVATVIFCWVLNKKLTVIRNHRAELEALIAAFNDSCVRAESGVKALRSATDEATRLQQYLERSQNLRDDLSYLVDRGGSLADRLEGGVRTARTEVGRPGAKPEARDNVSRLPERGAERTLERPSETPMAPAMGMGAAAEPRADRRAPRSAAPEAPVPAVEAEPAAPTRQERARPTRDRAALRQALGGTGGQADSAETDGEAAPRSRAERELLQALRARR
jgi:hypothetical protein